MVCTEDELLKFSIRVQKLADLGGISAIARRGKLARVTIYDILQGKKKVKDHTFDRFKKALTAIERSRSKPE